jgi:hypothetical protein
VQRALLSSLWTASPAAPISLRNPLVYLDRLRIRQPGDTSFAVGPHMDGGSTERWEPEGYGAGGSGVYDDIFKGEWESYNPWDAGSGRVEAVTNLYDGRGACSMLRLWQGWLSMSHSGPGEGTVLVYPLVKLATAYLLLRPFFRAIRGREEFIVSDKEGGEEGKERFLDPENWKLCDEADMTSELHGASLDLRQELDDELHPHLELGKTMVHVPPIRPGDFVAWHCDCESSLSFHPLFPTCLATSLSPLFPPIFSPFFFSHTFPCTRPISMLYITISIFPLIYTHADHGLRKHRPQSPYATTHSTTTPPYGAKTTTRSTPTGGIALRRPAAVGILCTLGWAVVSALARRWRRRISTRLLLRCCGYLSLNLRMGRARRR